MDIHAGCYSLKCCFCLWNLVYHSSTSEIYAAASLAEGRHGWGRVWGGGRRKEEKKKTEREGRWRRQ